MSFFRVTPDPDEVQVEAGTASDGDLVVYDATAGEWIAADPATAVGAYVTGEINDLIDAAPAALDTLNELAAALNDDANFATTVTNALAGKANLGTSNTFTTGGHIINNSVTTEVPLQVKGASGQTANLFEAKTFTSGTIRFSISDAGYTSTENVQSGGGIRIGTAVSYTTNQRWLSIGNNASVPTTVTSGAIVYADAGHLFARSVDANVGLTRQIINAQTGTSYTLAAGDSGALVTLSNGSPVTVEVPAESTTNYAVGTRIDLARLGDGTVTVQGASGVTVNSADAKLGLRVKFSSASLVKTGTNTWLLVGDLV